MYKLHLEKSYVPAQTDAEIREITVGGLLREIASNHPDSCLLYTSPSPRDVEESGLAGCG